MRQPPSPPQPEHIRRPSASFGWLDARLLHDRWLSHLGTDATAVMAFLALAANHDGVSYYARSTMALAIDLDVPRLDWALDRLCKAGLLAHRPWRRGTRDGVWQLLPVAERINPQRASATQSIADTLRDLGFERP